MSKWIKDFEETLGMLLMAMLLVTLFLQVFSRFVLGSPLIWTEEVSRYLFIYCALLGICTVAKRREHVKIDFFVNFLPRVPRKTIEVVLDISIVAVMCYLIYIGYNMALMQHRLSMVSLDLPMSWLYGAYPVATALLVIRLVQRLILDLRDFNQPQSGEES
ncbi:TRAP transporter small permease [Saccharospirillum salsuginis]|uniref:TRAP transporter small permease protein n=1 Tax=Saccharospirillum salsuginis TaxID=418750 RepID=A0A918N754_9GAMM|nr:TRAP transporter small permease [Saccharospirillum salsuginis]GGX41786.1 permease [Saccharospirillum salsuginis]